GRHVQVGVDEALHLAVGVGPAELGSGDIHLDLRELGAPGGGLEPHGSGGGRAEREVTVGVDDQDPPGGGQAQREGVAAIVDAPVSGGGRGSRSDDRGALPGHDVFRRAVQQVPTQVGGLEVEGLGGAGVAGGREVATAACDVAPVVAHVHDVATAG